MTTVAVILVLFPILAISVLAIDRLTDALRKAAEDDLENIVGNIVSMCRIQHGLLQQKVTSDLVAARTVLRNHGTHVVEDPSVLIPFEATDQETGETHSIRVPLWRINDRPITQTTWFVDEVQALLGGTCTIFQKIEGNSFLRTSTNVLKKDGTRAVGTYIPKTSPVAKAILSGETYLGRAYVVNSWHVTAYEPLRDRTGQIIGALYVGIQEQSTDALTQAIAGIKVGKTGYAFVADWEGNIILHPTKAGKNLNNLDDPVESRIIAQIVEKGRRLPDGEVGTMRYPWINVELAGDVF